VPSGVQSLLQNMPTGCEPITLVRTTTERQAIWPMSPTADPQPARGFDFYDPTVGAQLGFEGVSATGWSYRTGRGVRWRNIVPA
jgi:hypothetical protein